MKKGLKQLFLQGSLTSNLFCSFCLLGVQQYWLSAQEKGRRA